MNWSRGVSSPGPTSALNMAKCYQRSAQTSALAHPTLGAARGSYRPGGGGRGAHRGAQHHQSLRADDFAAAAQAVDDSLQVRDVTHTDPGQGVGVSGNGEDRLHLGDIMGDLFDVVDPGAPGEAQLSERLY